MEKREWSLRKTAKRAGMSAAALSKIVRGEAKHPRMDSLEGLAQAFGLESVDIFFGMGVRKSVPIEKGGGDHDPAA